MTRMSSPATKSRNRGLDEDTFQQLLAAAFVVQQHNDQSKTTATHEPKSASVERSPDDGSDANFESRPGFAYVMEEIVSTQHQIQTRRLALQQAMDLIVERVLTIAHADGAAIALLEDAGKEVEYCAAAGRSSAMAGRRIMTKQALCFESVRNGTTMQCADTAEDFRLDPRVCEKRGVGGLIAIPVYRDEVVAGALEVIFSKRGSFLDHDVRSCQLMAGMVTEALDRAADVELKQALVNERATVLAALAKLKPQLERIMETPATPAGPEDPSEFPSICSACGATFGKKDLKCVHCGVARNSRLDNSTQSKLASMVRNNGSDLTVAKEKPVSDSRAKNPQRAEPPASANLLKAPPRLPDFLKTPPVEEIQQDDEFEIPSSVIDDLEARLREYDPDRHVSASSETVVSDVDSETAAAEPEMQIVEIASERGEYEHTRETDEHADKPEHEGEALVAVPQVNEIEETTASETEEIELRITPAPVTEDAWTSASKARKWLESVTDPQSRTAVARFINRHKGEIYLAAAVLVVGFAVWWSVWGGGPSWKDFSASSGSPTAADGATSTRRRAKPQEPELSLLEKFLVSLGLAEAPPSPIYLGNPDVKVWVDLQTALYYCPNADLYGNTPKGKFTTQKDAQLDQFEPAYRKACD